MIERFPVWAPGEHGMERRRVYIYPVSYTHLTLPTKA